jgi:hypothetical protein
MSSSKYVHSAVQNVKEFLAALPGDQILAKNASDPFTGGYKPELDESPELDPARANFIQSQLGSSLNYQCFPPIFFDAWRPPGNCFPCVGIPGPKSQCNSCV